MSNLRIIYDNAVDVASSISASSTAAGFDIGNVRNDYKGKVHRSVGTSVTYTISWNGVNAEAIGAVVLPATNLSTDATIKVDMYSGVSGTGTLVYTSGTIYACPGLNIEDWDWNSPLNWNDNTNVNMFTFGKISKTAVWLVESNQFFSQKVCRSITITLNDPNNPVGYIDCARIIAGAFWEPTFNVDKNSLNITNVDTSTTSRANSGDLLFDRGASHDELTFDFSLLTSQDKEVLAKILRDAGTRKNILVSIFPEENTVREQSYLVYGKRTNSGIGQVFNKYYSNSLELIGW